jgi:hypothetical protein
LNGFIKAEKKMVAGWLASWLDGRWKMDGLL